MPTIDLVALRKELLHTRLLYISNPCNYPCNISENYYKRWQPIYFPLLLQVLQCVVIGEGCEQGYYKKQAPERWEKTW